MPSKRVELRGSHREPVAGARVGRKIDPAQRVTVLIEVRRKASPPREPNQVLTRSELASRFGASAEDMARVRAFAKKHKLQIISESAEKRTIEVAGTVADMGNAFGVSLNEARVGGVTFRQRRGSLTIPAELDGVITAVLGLDNRPQAEPRSALLPGSAPRTGTVLSPLDVAKLYDFPTGVDGSGQTIAIVELGGGFSSADLNTYFTGLGVPVPSVTAVPVMGGSNSPGVNPNADTEVMLDIEVAGAVAPKAKQRVYFAPNTDAGFIAAVKAAVHDPIQPCAISISWGKPESNWSQQARQSMESAFQDAANLGIPVTVAAGDDGSVDGTSALVTDFPASAPHALGCGGTKLQGSGSTISSEVVWNAKRPMSSPTGGGATGGGVSAAFPKPSYQSSVSVPSAPAPGGRGVPDVCGNASNDSPYKVRISGADGAAYGTSAVAPLWAGLIALFAQKLGKPVGFLNTAIYKSGSPSSAFRDITSGDNDISGGGGQYHASTGWDPCTGLGSPKGKALLAALQGSAPAPGPSPHPSPSPAPHPSPSPAPHPSPSPAPHPSPSPSPSPSPGPTPTPSPGPPGTGSTGQAFSAWMPPPYPPYPVPPMPSPIPPVGTPMDLGLRQGAKPTLGVVSVVGLIVLGVVGVVGLADKP